MDDKKIIDIIYNSEKVADQILVNKQEIVNYDKKRQGNRESIREMKKSNEKKVWITVGSMLIEMNKDEAIKVIQKGEIWLLKFSSLCFSSHETIFFRTTRNRQNHQQTA